MFKLTSLIFINALMRIAGYPPGIVRIEYPEVFTQEGDRGIMDLPVLTIHDFYIIFEFHKQPLTSKTLLRNFQYLANFRAKVNRPVELHIILLDPLKRSVKSVSITPDWDFAPKFTYLIDFDGDKILSSIKYKLKNSIPLTERETYLLAVLPFTKHNKGIVEFAVELIYWVNEVELPEEAKYVVKMSQIFWVQSLIGDETLSNQLMDVIKMQSTFIQNYEKNLIESAVESAVGEIAEKLSHKGLSRDEILETTGVDISKK